MKKIDTLIELLKKAEEVFIQTHNSPDPDAIASAFGLQYLLSQRGITSDICYKGIIDKYNTQRMVELLDIKLKNINEIENMDDSDYIVLVDSQKGNSNITDFIGNEVASIDHHPKYQKIDYLYEDIRPDVGACSAIIAEYFAESGIDIPRNVATALLYGIKMDTLDLSRGVSDLDLDSFCMLYKISDIGLINKIQFNSLQFEELYAYGNAIKNIKVFDNIGFSNVSLDCPDCLLGTISDFILSIKEVDIAIVYSPKVSGIKFSIRNEIESLDAGKIINEVLSELGNGGGHKSMAGGFLPAANMSKITGQIDSFIENRFIEVINSFYKHSTCIG